MPRQQRRLQQPLLGHAAGPAVRLRRGSDPGSGFCHLRGYGFPGGVMGMERGGGGLHLRAVGLRPATLCLEAVGRPCGRWDAQSWPLSPQLLVTAIPPPPPSLPFPAFPLQPTPPTSPLLSASPESSPARTTAASRSAGNATGTTTAWITATRRPSCAVRNASAGGSGGWGGAMGRS